MRISSILATALAACVVVACGGDGPANGLPPRHRIAGGERRHPGPNRVDTRT